MQNNVQTVLNNKTNLTNRINTVYGYETSVKLSEIRRLDARLRKLEKKYSCSSETPKQIISKNHKEIDDLYSQNKKSGCERDVLKSKNKNTKSTIKEEDFTNNRERSREKEIKEEIAINKNNNMHNIK